MKNCSLDLKEHATKIINYDKKEMIPLTNEEVVYVKNDLVLMMAIKNIKSEIIVITQENIEELL